jgi:hypothetical protein
MGINEIHVTEAAWTGTRVLQATRDLNEEKLH